MFKHHTRSHSSAAESRETTENLYDLGLLSRPRKTSLASTADSLPSLNGPCPNTPS